MAGETASPLVSAAELDAMLREGGVAVLDATVHFPPARFDGDYRPESGYDGWVSSHIPGSRHVDLMDVFSEREAALHFTRPSTEQLMSDLQSSGIEPGATIVIYDQGSTTWASRLWWVFRNAGIEARVLDGGVAEWTRCGFALASGADVTHTSASKRWSVTDLGLWSIYLALPHCPQEKKPERWCARWRLSSTRERRRRDIRDADTFRQV